MIASSTRARSTPVSGLVLTSEIAKLQDAVGSLDELLHFGFGFVELVGCLSKELDAFLEETE